MVEQREKELEIEVVKFRRENEKVLAMQKEVEEQL